MLAQKLTEDMRAAMKAGDKARTSALRMAVTAIQHAELAPPGEEPDDAAVQGVLAKEIKKCTDTATIYDEAQRPDAAASERADAAILAEYLPAELTDDELAAVVDEALAAVGASTMADMGAAMRAVTAAVAGRATGGRVAALVKSRLSR